MESKNDHGTRWNDAVNRRIREARTTAGMTQAELATKMEVTQQAISKIERPGAFVSDRTVKDVAGACGVTVEWLLTGNGPVKSVDQEENELLTFCEKVMKGESDGFRRGIVAAVSKMTDAQCDALLVFARLLLEETGKRTEEVPAPIATDAAEATAKTRGRKPLTREAAHAELDRQFDLREEPEEPSRDSGATGSG